MGLLGAPCRCSGRPGSYHSLDARDQSTSMFRLSRSSKRAARQVAASSAAGQPWMFTGLTRSGTYAAFPLRRSKGTAADDVGLVAEIGSAPAALQSAVAKQDAQHAAQAFALAVQQRSSVPAETLLSALSLWLSQPEPVTEAAAGAWQALLAAPTLRERGGDMQARLVHALQSCSSVDALCSFIAPLRVRSAGDSRLPASQALLTALATQGHFQGVGQVLEVMAGMAAPPTPEAAQAWMGWLSGQGRHAEALAVFDRMYGMGLPVTSALLVDVLRACRVLGEATRGIRYWRALVARGGRQPLPTTAPIPTATLPGSGAPTSPPPPPPLTLEAWEAYAACAAAGGHRGVVVESLYACRSAGVPPSMDMYNSALLACAAEGSAAMALSLYDDAVASGLQPTGESFVHLLAAAAAVASPDIAAEVLLLWQRDVHGRRAAPPSAQDMARAYRQALRATLRSATEAERRARHLPASAAAAGGRADDTVAHHSPTVQDMLGVVQPGMEPRYAGLRGHRPPQTLSAPPSDAPVVGDLLPPSAAGGDIRQGLLLEHRASTSVPVVSSLATAAAHPPAVGNAWQAAWDAHASGQGAFKTWPWGVPATERAAPAEAAAVDVSCPGHLLQPGWQAPFHVPALDDEPPASVTGIPDDGGWVPWLALRWMQDARAAASAGEAPGLAPWHYGAVIRCAAATAAAGLAAPPVWTPLRDGSLLAVDRHVVVAEAAVAAALADGIPLDPRILPPLMHLYAAPHLALHHLADSGLPGLDAAQPGSGGEEEEEGAMWHWGMTRARLFLRGALTPDMDTPDSALSPLLAAVLGEDFARAGGAGGALPPPLPLDPTAQPAFPWGAAFPEALRARPPLPQAALTALVTAAGAGGDPGLSFAALHSCITEHRCVPEEQALQAALHAAVRCGVVEHALAFLQQCSAAGVAPSHGMCDVVIAGAVAQDAPHLADAVVELMEQHGIRPSPATMALLQGAAASEPPPPKAAAAYAALRGEGGPGASSAPSPSRRSRRARVSDSIYDLVASETGGAPRLSKADPLAGLLSTPAEVREHVMVQRGAAREGEAAAGSAVQPPRHRRRRALPWEVASAAEASGGETSEEEEAVSQEQEAGLLQSLDEDELLQSASEASGGEEEGGGAGEAPGSPRPCPLVDINPDGERLSAQQARTRQKMVPLTTPEEDAAFKAAVASLVAEGTLPAQGLHTAAGHLILPIHEGVVLKGPPKRWLRYVFDEGPLTGLEGGDLLAVLDDASKAHNRYLMAWLRNRDLALPPSDTRKRRGALLDMVVQHAPQAAELLRQRGLEEYVRPGVRERVLEVLGHFPHMHVGLTVKQAFGGARHLTYSRMGERAPQKGFAQGSAAAGGGAPCGKARGRRRPALTEAQAADFSADFAEHLPDGLTFSEAAVWHPGSRRGRADEGPLADLPPVDVKLELDLRPTISFEHLRAWLGNRGYSVAGSVTRKTLYRMVQEVAMRDAVLEGGAE